jgi:membrane protease YdiL (CAAX protease family)
MTKKKLILGIILVILGMIGIVSILTMDIPLPKEIQTLLEGRFSPTQIKLLTLINPTIMLVIAVIIGTVLYEKATLKVPVIEKIVGIRNDVNFSGILKYGVFGGTLSGVLLSIVSLLFNPILPAEFIELGENFKPTLATRFLYGGFTEEILMRFGLMTFVVWLSILIFGKEKPIAFWIGILVAGFIFALGHLPIVFQTVGSPTAVLLSYILIGNLIGGIIFGWLYWKKGLESAFIAHIFAHIIMVIAEPIFS